MVITIQQLPMDAIRVRTNHQSRAVHNPQVITPSLPGLATGCVQITQLTQADGQKGCAIDTQINLASAAGRTCTLFAI